MDRHLVDGAAFGKAKTASAVLTDDLPPLFEQSLES
jgi:hypothetical protein